MSCEGEKWEGTCGDRRVMRMGKEEGEGAGGGNERLRPHGEGTGAHGEGTGAHGEGTEASSVLHVSCWRQSWAAANAASAERARERSYAKLR